MGTKPFKTYQELIQKLRSKNMVIAPEDEATVVSLLKKYSYFSLVSGYKTLFKASDGNYFQGTTIDDILALYQFDEDLRDTFFHAIQIVEKNIKSLLSYSFVSKFGENQSEYLSAANYDCLPGSKDEAKLQRQKEIKKLISTFVAVAMPPSEHDYINHQSRKHNNVPLWVAVKAMSFGSASKMYSLCFPAVQSGIAKEFTGLSEAALAGMLDMLTRVRNVCAHNERLYDFSVKKSRAIQNMPVHMSLGITKNPSGGYKQGKTDLLAALICFKYLLDDTDFVCVVSCIDVALTKLLGTTKLIPPTKILSCMGFPLNWKDIVALPKV